MDCDNLLSVYEPPEVLMKYFPIGRTGSDKLGCPGTSESHLYTK